MLSAIARVHTKSIRAVAVCLVTSLSGLGSLSVSLTGCSTDANSASDVATKTKKPHKGLSGKGVVKGKAIQKMLASQGPEHAVYSLIDNRLLAHMVKSDGLLIPVGLPGVAKYLQFRRPWKPWLLNRKVDNRPVALANKSVSWLVFPLVGRQAKATTLSIRLKSPKVQGLRISVNGQKLPNRTLQEGWQLVQATLAAGLLKEGENRIDLRWGVPGRFEGLKAFAAVEWLYVGSEALAEAYAIRMMDDGALWLGPGEGYTYYVYPYKGAKLRLTLNKGETAGCRLKVRAGSIDLNLELTANTHLVDLEPIAERVSRLTIQSEGTSCQGIGLAKAEIVMPGVAPKIKRGAKPEYVLFWLIDNARSDRYRSYNPKTRVVTPVIENLGKTGTVFTRAYVAGTESRVSHASIWTGMYPKQHQFIAPKAVLRSRFVTMPEAIKKGGLRTAAWVANGFVSKRWGFAEGWRDFRNTLHDGGGLHAEALANHGIKFIEKTAGSPFFLYVGTIDVHVSWRARQPWLKTYYPAPYSGKYTKAVWGKDVEKIAGGKTKVSATDKKRILAIFDSTVSYNDHHLGRVLKALEAKGIRDKTMVVITADHGEELWDYGRIGHGHSLRDPVVDVPLIINYPPLFGSGVRVREGVDTLAVMPTILDAIGAPIPSEVQGGSLLGLAQGVGRGYPRPSLATQYELAHTVRLEDFKLWVGGRGVPMVYDLRKKHSEATDISESKPLVTRWLTDCLSTFLIYQARWRQSRWGVASNHLPQMAADLELGTGPGPISR